MGENTSKTRAWIIVTVVLVLCIVAVGLGLGFGLKRKDDDNEKPDASKETECPEPPSSSRLTKDSPIYVKPTDIPEGNYRFASVAVDAKICSSLGTEMMIRHGGSAVDGAITATLCSGVYNPQSCGIGGGFFMTFYKRSTQEKHAIMAREMAPAAATENMYVGGAASSTDGGMAIAIPGEIRGMYEAHQLGGKLPWKDLFRPIIQMCTDGIIVGPLLEKNTKSSKHFFDDFPELKKLVTTDSGALVKVGNKIKFPKLAVTMEKIADDPFTFYNGTLAADLAADIQEAGGIITEADLLAYTAAVKAPVSITVSGGYTAISPPPPSSGAVLLLILNILSGYNMSAANLKDVPSTVETFHRITEAFKHGFSVRTNLGDSDVEDQQFKDDIQALITNMTSLDWGATKRSKITHDTHDTAYYEPTYDFIDTDAGTSHINVLAPNGDAVAVTSTINTYFGSKVVGNRTGIFFNNEMDDFSTPNTTNSWQVPASPANFIKPYKRPLSSMSPTIVVDANGDVKLVTGCSGGTRIITANALSIIHTLWLKLGLKEAIEYPRFHHQLLPEEIWIEQEMPQAIMDGLAERGHKFDIRDLGSSLQAILHRDMSADSVQNNDDENMGDIFSYCDPVHYGRPDGV